jgi:hypothetical protein
MRRGSRWALLATAVVSGLLVAAYTVRGVVIAPYLRQWLVGAAAQHLGVSVSVGRIGGSLVTGLAIDDIATVAPGTEGPVTILGLRRIRARYSLPDLLGGIDYFLGRTAIDVDGARLALDLSRAAPRDRGEATAPAAVVLPAVLPRLHLRNSAVAVDGPGYRVAADGITLATEPQGDNATGFALQADRLAWSHPYLEDGTTSLSARLAYTPDAVAVESLALGASRVVEEARVDLTGLPSRLGWTARLHVFGGAVAVEGHCGSEHVDADLHIAGLSLEDFFAVVRLGEVTAGGQLDATAHLRLVPSHPADLIGDLTLAVADPSFRNLHGERLALDATAGDGVVRVAHLDLVAGLNTASLREIAAPIAPLLARDWETIARQARATVTAQLHDLPALLATAGVTMPANATAIPPHRLEVDGEVRDGMVRVARGALETDTGTVALQGVTVTLPNPGQPVATAPVTGHLHIAVPDLAPLATLFSLPPLRGAVHGDVAVAGTLGAPVGRAEMMGSDLALRRVPIGALALRATAMGRRLVVDHLELSHASDRVNAHGALDLASHRLEGVVLTADIDDLAPYLNPLLPTDRQVCGALAATLSASGSYGDLVTEVVATFHQGEVAGLAIPAARVHARWRDDELRVDPAQVETPYGTVSAAGTVTTGDGQGALAMVLDTLNLSREGLDLALNTPARVSRTADGRYSVEDLRLAGAAGQVEVAGVVAPVGASDVTLRLTGFTGDGWLGPLMADRFAFAGLDGVLHLSGPLDNPTVSAHATVVRVSGRGAAFPVAGAVDLAYGNGGVTVNRFDWTAEGDQHLTITGRLPLDPSAPGWLQAGPIALAATLELPDFRLLGDLLPRSLRNPGATHGVLELSGTWAHPVGELHLSAEGVTLPTAIRPAPPGPFAVHIAAALEDRDLSLRELRIDSPGLHATASATWRAMPAPPALLAEGRGALTGEVTAQGSFSIPDLGWAAAGIDSIRRLAGSIAGEVQVTGPAQAPQVEARVSLADGEVRPEVAVPSLRAVNGIAVVTTDRVQIEAAHGELGGAPFAVAGEVERRPGGTPRVALALRGENLLLFRDVGVKVRADTDVKVTGPIDRLEITGDFAITDGRLVKNVDFLAALRGSGRPDLGGGMRLFSLPDPPLSQARLRVRVTAKEPFQIRTNVARGTVRPEVLLTGTGELPVVVGEVYVDPTRIRLPAGVLRVDAGVVRFLEGEPERPRLDLVGGAKMLGYDISVHVDGPYDDPVVTLSSTPPLSDEELLLLLLTGLPPKTPTTQASTKAAGMNVAVYVSKGLLARWFGSEAVESDESIVDRFEVEVGRGVTRSGDETIDTQFRLAEHVIRAGDVLYLTAEKDTFDDVNAGVKLVFRFQ